MSVPLVSIICCAYNHEPYIRQCLDGFIMQETNFPFEVLIHDDASTDKTADIIKEYEAKYSTIIKPIYQTENQYQKNTGILKTFQFPRAKGKYIAMCEGDDYWTDPLKLQKQVDFLDKYAEYSMCSHNMSKLFQESQFIISQDDVAGDLSIDDLVRGKFPIQTATVLYRNYSSVFEKYGTLKYAMDASLFYLLLKEGKCHILKDNMSVYRIHSTGVWSGSACNHHVARRINVVKALYESECTDLAARYLLNQYAKGVSRIWMFKNLLFNLHIIKIGSKHLGCRKMLHFILKKMFLGINVIY